ncbi:TfoX/Sxy family protein [Denitromonas iodatirespirans]|uniref:TfoX/Sxy family protein n=1 Tax=Denitromonas iodatirespirans TaxID=2795389 RepID=A0A944DCZ1_DENI1|nr:TfoX/Sxy family protein [Denitromonas iodatirespirans]MBT0962203.1 TfoX/Sxy family protein [Denitromonas iodatirespirans]
MPRKPPEIVTHALELFAPLGAVRVKSMFGGWGFYLDDLFFALEAWETLYLKADTESEKAFIDAGCSRFIYTQKDGKTFSMGYWTAPEEALDSPAAMAPWARLAIECALRNRKPKKPRRKPG